jgi:hypothetical protein
MASEPTLSENLLNTWLSVNADTAVIGATTFATAYETYALESLLITDDTLDTGNKAGCISALSSLTPTTTVEVAALAIENAIIAFWTAAIFKVDSLILPPGFSTKLSAVVTVPPIPGSLYPSLLSFLTESGRDKQQTSDQLASILHTTLSTITVTISGMSTSAPPVPISIPSTVA